MKVDTHLHIWNMQYTDYPWLIPAYGPIYRNFEAAEAEPFVQAAGIDKVVLVQAMDSYADTEFMFEAAQKHAWIGGVVGWVPLLKPDEASKKLAEHQKNHPVFKGMRHLIHEEKDPDWVVQDTVIEGLKVLASFNYTFDIVAVFPNQLKHVPTLAEKIPDLKMVIDHLAKPPIKNREMGDWADQLARAAEYPNVYAKISGLNTADDWETWSADSLKPYIDYAIEKFGADRLMFGSDWPVAILAGDYAKVWQATVKALQSYSPEQQAAILGGTAQKFYNL